MTQLQGSAEMHVLLVGEDAALLEGLSQSFAALGYSPRVAESLHQARENAQKYPPLMVVIGGDLANESPADVMAIPLAPGGVFVLYHGTVDSRPAIVPSLQRAVMADLTLPLERNRLMALAQHVTERVRVTGRAQRRTPPEQQAF
jgi:DNA-binding NtrC family response regulator